jgi:hypothetical protein
MTVAGFKSAPNHSGLIFTSVFVAFSMAISGISVKEKTGALSYIIISSDRLTLENLRFLLVLNPLAKSNGFDCTNDF